MQLALAGGDFEIHADSWLALAMPQIGSVTIAVS